MKMRMEQQTKSGDIIWDVFECGKKRAPKFRAFRIYFHFSERLFLSVTTCELSINCGCFSCADLNSLNTLGVHYFMVSMKARHSETNDVTTHITFVCMLPCWGAFQNILGQGHFKRKLTTTRTRRWLSLAYFPGKCNSIPSVKARVGRATWRRDGKKYVIPLRRHHFHHDWVSSFTIPPFHLLATPLITLWFCF